MNPYGSPSLQLQVAYALNIFQRHVGQDPESWNEDIIILTIPLHAILHVSIYCNSNPQTLLLFYQKKKANIQRSPLKDQLAAAAPKPSLEKLKL